MRILYLCNAIDKSGGLDRVLIEKANYLSINHNVFIVTTKQKEKKYFYELSNRVKHIDISDIENCIYCIKTLKNIIKSIKPDIIVVATGKESLILPFINDNIPIIKEIHFSRKHRVIQNRNSHIIKKLLFKIVDYIEYKVAARYDSFVVLTDEDQENWNLLNTKVIYNFKTISSTEVSSLDKKNIIAVGRLDYQKGFDLLLKVWEKVVKNNKDWKLNIYGEGKLKEELIGLAKSLKIENSVIFHGNSKNMKENYLKNSLYVLSSRHEGLPLVLPEAMECGLPIISFSCPCGPKDIIEDGVNGYLIDNYNIESMYKKIDFLIKNQNERIKMGAKAKDRALLFDKDKIMNKWIHLFEDTISKKLNKEL